MILSKIIIWHAPAYVWKWRYKTNGNDSFDVDVLQKSGGILKFVSSIYDCFVIQKWTIIFSLSSFLYFYWLNTPWHFVKGASFVCSRMIINTPKTYWVFFFIQFSIYRHILCLFCNMFGHGRTSEICGNAPLVDCSYLFCMIRRES